MREMNHPVFVLAWALGAALPPAAAQPMYRCGNAYSQTPCAADAQAVKIHADAVPDSGPGAAGLTLCAATAAKTLGSAEPDSARTQLLAPRRSEPLLFAGQTLSAHHYELSVDVKLPNGGHSGPVAFSCWLSEDQARVLQFGPRGSTGAPRARR